MAPVGTHRVCPFHRVRPKNQISIIMDHETFCRKADAFNASLQGKIIQFSPSPYYRFSHAVCRPLDCSPFPRHDNSILVILPRLTFLNISFCFRLVETKPTSLTFVRDRRESTSKGTVVLEIFPKTAEFFFSIIQMSIHIKIFSLT